MDSIDLSAAAACNAKENTAIPIISPSQKKQLTHLIEGTMNYLNTQTAFQAFEK
jgi:hypothetical protein